MFDHSPSPEFDAARARWESHRAMRHGPTRDLSFDRMIEIFASQAESLRDVATSLGISRQAASVLFRTYLAPIYGATQWSSKRDERHMRMRAEAFDRRARLVLASDEFLRKIAQKAQEAGCAIQPVPVHDTVHMRTRALYVNGHRCRLHQIMEARAAKKNCSVHYARWEISPRSVNEYDAQIIDVAVSGWQACTYVIPNRVLVRAYDDCRERPRASYVPMSDAKQKQRHRRRIDYSRYREAWSLLPMRETLEPDSS